MTRMFPFVTETWNPVAGGPCPYKCVYCWATDLKERNDWEKYKGPWRLHEKQMKQKFKPGAFVFVQDMSDIGYPEIPEDVILEVFHRIAQFPKTRFLLLTKNPAFYNEYIWDLPDNVICGATIETDDDRIAAAVSLALQPSKRIQEITWASCTRDDLDYFVAIEPILMFSNPVEFARKIRYLEPWAVAVGYDNHSHKLDEPVKVNTEALIVKLKAFTTVYEKTIREAWWE